MEKGEVRFDGPTAELLDRPDILRAVFLQGAAAGATADGHGDGDGAATATAEPAVERPCDRSRREPHDDPRAAA